MIKERDSSTAHLYEYDARQLKFALNKNGVDPGHVDRTNGVSEFQQDNGLLVLSLVHGSRLTIFPKKPPACTLGQGCTYIHTYMYNLVLSWRQPVTPKALPTLWFWTPGRVV